jgi:hypothetical protein
VQDKEVASGESENPQKANSNPFSVAYSRFKRIPITGRVVGGALMGVLILAAVARFLPDMKERMKFFTDSVLGWLVFVIVAVQAYIYKWQAKIMGDSLVISQCARVGVHSIEPDWPDQILYLIIENTGHVPADDIEVSGIAEVIIPMSANKAQVFDHAFKQPFYRAQLTSGNLKIKVRILLDRVPPEYLPLNPGNAIFRVAGHISYKDGFGNNECDFELTHWNANEGWVVFPVQTIEDWARIREQEKTSHKNEKPN